MTTTHIKKWWYLVILIIVILATVTFLLIEFDKESDMKSMKFDLYQHEYDRVMRQAARHLSDGPVAVTSVEAEESAGSKYDYFSEGDYWWPNPKDPNGAYIRRDGIKNHENFNEHRILMRRFSKIVTALTAAYKLTGDEKYADRAMDHLRAWFIDDDTKMNPSLLYAQAIKGRTTGRGVGTMDAVHLVEVAQAVRVLELSGYAKEKDLALVKNWFQQYLHWLTTHEYGIDARNNGNNISSAWALQVATYARLVDDKKTLDEIRNYFKNVLISKQMAANGSFPKELTRTRSYNYSLFNLDLLSAIAHIASTHQDDLWMYTTSDGRGMQKAVSFMTPYIEDKTQWPFERDVAYFESFPVRSPFLLFAGYAFDNTSYISLWKHLKADPTETEIVRHFPIKQPVLWI